MLEDQMKAQISDLIDAFLIIGLLQKFMTACKNNNIDEEAAMWLIIFSWGGRPLQH